MERISGKTSNFYHIVIVFFLSILVSWFIVQELYILAFIPILGFVLILLLIKWEWVPVVLLPLIWYIPSFTSPDSPLEEYIIFRWFGLISIVSVFSIQVVRNLASGKRFELGFMGKAILALTLIAVLSAFLNGQGAGDLLGYLALYLQYPLFFIFLINSGVSAKVCGVFLVVFLLLIFIQVPEVIFRFLVKGIYWDNISATLGTWGTYNIGVFSIYAIAFITGHAVVRGVRWVHFALVGILLMIGVIGEIKVLILSAPFVVGATLLAGFGLERVKPFLNMRVILILIVVIILVLLAYSEWDKIYTERDNALAKFVESLTDVFSQGRFHRNRLYSIDRIGPVFILLDLLGTGPLNLFLGFGPGSSLAGTFFGVPGILFELMPDSFVLTQISATLADVGLLGFSVYVFLFITFFRLVIRVRHQVSDPFEKIVVYGSTGVLLFYAVLGPIYNIVWRSDAASFVFYFFMAYCYMLYRNSQGLGSPER